MRTIARVLSQTDIQQTTVDTTPDWSLQYPELFGVTQLYAMPGFEALYIVSPIYPMNMRLVSSCKTEGLLISRNCDTKQVPHSYDKVLTVSCHSLEEPAAIKFNHNK